MKQKYLISGIVGTICLILGIFVVISNKTPLTPVQKANKLDLFVESYVNRKCEANKDIKDCKKSPLVRTLGMSIGICVVNEWSKELEEAARSPQDSKRFKRGEKKALKILTNCEDSVINEIKAELED